MSTETIEKKKIRVDNSEKIELKKPAMYRVMLHNNDITPFETVKKVLKEVFKHNSAKAQDIMMQAHRNGKAQCYDNTSKKIAEAMKKKAEDYCERKELEEPTILSSFGNFPLQSRYKDLKFSVEKVLDEQ